jgi:serine/threonine protein kinase
LARAPLRAGDPARIGHYRLTARLGSGGMGVVYLGIGWDGSQVAVKVLRPELADDAEFRRRFRREVSALMRVRGLCTVRVIEADTESPRPFMVTEYAEGPSLAEYIDSYGPIGPDMLYGLAAGLAEALAVIHAAGIVHRDLKPSNVILTDAGPKAIDFGIAQALDATSMTRTGMMVGSAGFMAPEQISGRPGPAADIFVWGGDGGVRGHRPAAVRHRGYPRGPVPGHARRPGDRRCPRPAAATGGGRPDQGLGPAAHRPAASRPADQPVGGAVPAARP